MHEFKCTAWMPQQTRWLVANWQSLHSPTQTVRLTLRSSSWRSVSTVNLIDSFHYSIAFRVVWQHHRTIGRSLHDVASAIYFNQSVQQQHDQHIVDHQRSPWALPKRTTILTMSLAMSQRAILLYPRRLWVQQTALCYLFNWTQTLGCKASVATHRSRWMYLD